MYNIGRIPACGGNRAIRSNSSAPCGGLRYFRFYPLRVYRRCAPFIVFSYRTIVGGHAALHHPVNTLRTRSRGGGFAYTLGRPHSSLAA